ncbi:MAG TPA: acyl-CoA thioesterase [Pseudoxanthomonas sp.]|jgi:acyl-CoA hydrolase|nr:acyl-CoA thioesterase [Pseudoxanthomonas sp.]
MPGQQHEVTFRFLAQPTDVNFGGKVHGGMAMKWIDQAGYACAVAWSGAYCVTASVSGIQFVAPILIGDLVTVRARLIHTGSSSMHMAVDVLASDLRKDERRLATSCVMVFVALDAPDGKPTPVARWEPRDDAERQLQAHARRLQELSREMGQLVDARGGENRRDQG